MQQGYLKLIIGPMFSGKTTSLIDIYNNIQNKSTTIVINHASDKRYTDKNEMMSHDLQGIPCFNFNQIREIYDIESDLNNINNILINEAQFFPDLVKMVTIFVEKYKMNVYVVGLDGDFKQKKFGPILELIPLCDDVIKIHGKCAYCDLPSSFSKRISDEEEQISVGTVNYKPTCRKCHA